MQDIGVVGGGGSGPHSCGFGKSWVGMDRLTPSWWCVEKEPPGSRVPAGRPGRVGGCRRYLEPWRLDGAIPRGGAAARLLPTTDILNKAAFTHSSRKQTFLILLHA